MNLKNQTSYTEELIASSRVAIASGELSEEEIADLEKRCVDLEQRPKEEREAYDHFFRHMPDDDSDITLVVLKGHLLIEQKIREFIAERMLTPEALIDAHLTSHQAICLADALTLENDNPRILWSVLRKLNSLRNQLAHNLASQGIEDRVRNIVAEYSTKWPVNSKFTGVLGHAYGQVAELCRLARNPSFQIKGKVKSK